MGWPIVEQENAVVVTMTSNKVNVINDDFIGDLNEAFDKLENQFSQKPVILTAEGSAFSAGLDFHQVFPMFARGDRDEINNWFDIFREMMMRLFNFKWPLVAAINGHAFAGGLILALCCDYRIAVKGQAKMSLNEVLIGIPMPNVYTEVIRHAVGSKVAEDIILTGRTYNVEEAQQLGLLHELVNPSELIERALAHVKPFSQSIMPAYSYSKKGLRSPAMERILNYSIPLDRTIPEILSSEESIRAQTKTFERLMSK